MNLWKIRNFYIKYLPILLFIVTLNIAIKKCSISETELKSDNKSSNYKKYFELSYLGDREIKKKNYKKALEYYEQARDYDSDMADVSIANIYYNFISKEEGEKKYKQAYNNGIFEVAYTLGNIAYRKGDFNLAKEWYLKGSEKGNERSSIELAKLLISENNETEAKKFLLKVENGNRAEGLYYLMTIYYKEKNKGKINELKNKMLKKNKMYQISDEMMLKIGLMLGGERENRLFESINNTDSLIRIRKYEEAKKEYEKFLEYSFEGNYFLGTMYDKLDNKAEALKYYKIAYEKGKMGISAYKIGNIYEENNNIIEAKKWYQIGIDLDDSQSLVSLGEIKLKESNDEDAKELFLKGIDKKNAEAMLGMVAYYKKKNNDKKAREMAERIISEKGLLYNDVDLYNTALQVVKIH